MKRHLAALILVFALAATLQAQVYARPGWNPYFAGGVYYPPNQPQIQYLGTLPNGIQVFNPWNMYNNLNNQQPIYYGTPYYYTPLYLYPNYYNGYGAYSPYTNSTPVIQRVPGRFVLAGYDLAINPIAGVTLAPYRGVALTSEGVYYRAPGSGSYNAYGAFIPGSGAYINPMNGDVYQPGSGIIIRR